MMECNTTFDNHLWNVCLLAPLRVIQASFTVRAVFVSYMTLIDTAFPRTNKLPVLQTAEEIICNGAEFSVATNRRQLLRPATARLANLNIHNQSCWPNAGGHYYCNTLIMIIRISLSVLRLL